MSTERRADTGGTVSGADHGTASGEHGAASSDDLPVHWQPPPEGPVWSACGNLGPRGDPAKLARLTADRTAVTCMRCKGTRLWRET